LSNLTYASICSGIEAAHFAFEPLGFKPLWFSEVDPFCKALLAHYHPNTPNYGDMLQLTAKITQGQIKAPDILLAGTPCQSFSSMGKKKGLYDARGNLTLELVNILNALDLVRAKENKPPIILLWENVKGVLNSDDNAFGHFLAKLTNANQPLTKLSNNRKSWASSGWVLSPKRQIAWRLLNAKYFGVPQSRPRLYLVANSAKSRTNPAKILFEQTDGNKHSQALPSRRQEVTTAFKQSANSGNRKISLYDARGNRKIAKCLTAANNTSIITANFIIEDNGVRSLTPIEYERLQGLPDNYTQIEYKGKDKANCPHTLRIKALGNAWCVPVIKFLAARIKANL